MIAAPFLAGCSPALDRAAWLALSRGALDRIAWPPPSWIAWTLLLPALLLTATALWAWHGRRRNAAVAIALGAIAVHPPLVVSLAPLLARPSAGRARIGPADWTRLALVGVGAAVLLLWLTPDCSREAPFRVAVLLRGIVETLRTAAGVIAGVLALFETIRSPRAAHTIAAWLTIAGSLLAVAVFQAFDARVTLVPAVVALWWLAARGGAALIAARPTLPARGGAIVVLALVPVLQAWAVAPVPAAAPPYAHTDARTVAGALARMWKPAAIVSEDAAHDRFATIWAAGQRQRGTTWPLVTADTTIPDVAPRALYAFAGGRHRLQLRGTLMAPVRAPESGVPILWRALASRPCTPVGPQWQDVTPLVADGQISGVFERGATGRHALLYAALPADVAVASIDWPEIARPGLRITGFDLGDPQSRQEYYRGALADDMPLTLIPSDTPFVARVVLGRMERTPGALAIAFDTIPQRLVARLDTGANTDRLELCPSTQDLPLVGYPEAPAIAAIAITSPAVVGRGWHPHERAGDFRFRWTAAREADLRFIAMGPARLAFTVHVAAAAGGARDASAVLLNGVAASCVPRDGGCAWHLPIHAMKVGLNLLTVQAPVTSGPDPRGLQVTGAELYSIQ